MRKNYFESNATQLAASYESTSFHKVHEHLIEYLPPEGSQILDIGCGSGRDAAALAQLGYKVCACDPSSKLLEFAKKAHFDANITWVNTGLPELDSVQDGFEFILLSAVWMFIPIGVHDASIKIISNKLKPHGKVGFVVKLVCPEHDVLIGKVDIPNLKQLCLEHGLILVGEHKSSDSLGRQDDWETLVFEKSYIP